MSYKGAPNEALAAIIEWADWTDDPGDNALDIVKAIEAAGCAIVRREEVAD